MPHSTDFPSHNEATLKLGIMKQGFIVACLLLMYLCGHAQYDHLKFKHYTTDNGLSQGSIYHIYQDRKGFIWLATWDGLNRFDGYQFTVFKPNLHDANSIKGSRISSILEDESGYIWVGTYEALNRYDPSTHQFKQFYVKDETGNNLETRYNPFYLDDKHELWFTYQTKNLASLNLTTFQITYYHFADGAMQHYSLGTSDKQHKKLETIYTCGSDGLHVLDLKDNKLSYLFSSEPQNLEGAKKFIWHLVDDGSLIWLCTQDDLYSFDKLNNQLTAYPFTSHGYNASAFTSSTIDQKGILWCSTEGNGLWLFDIKQKKFIRHFTNDNTDVNSISGNILNSIFADKEDNIWVNSDPKGIDVTNPYQQFFRVINYSDSNRVGPSNSVWSMCPLGDDEVIICFNQSGPMLYNFITKQRKVFNMPHEFKNISIYHIVKDQLGQLWMATDFGLYITRDTFKHIQKINPIHSFNATLCEHANSMLLSTDAGVLQFSISNPTWPPTQIASLLYQKGSAFVVDSTGYLYVATTDKKLLVCDKKFQVKRVTHFPFLIKCILPMPQGILWLGTNLGLVKYTISSNQYHSFTEADGLANQFIYGIQEDEKGKLWLSSNKGIICFNPRTEEIVNFDIANGLQGWEFNTRSYCKMNNGTMLFGGVGGANYFNPTSYTTEKFDCNLELIRAVINNQDIPLNAIQNPNKPYHCKPTQNTITLEFVALDFMKSNSMIYYYKLHPEDDWISLGNKRTLQLVNMESGNYEIQIQVRASNKAVSPKELKLFVEIASPFYKRWWFFVLCFILASTVFYGFYYFKLKSVQRVEAIRNKLSRDLHDDIGGTLSSINMLSRASTTLNVESAAYSLDKIHQRSQKILGKMSDIIWNINPQNDGVEDMITRMRNYAAIMLEASGIEYQMNFPKEKLDDKISLDKKSNTYLIFKEAINNLCKYSQATLAILEVNYRDKKLYVHVEDNGKGFDITQLNHRGGLDTMKQRAKEMKATLTIESTITKGTSIKLVV